MFSRTFLILRASSSKLSAMIPTWFWQSTLSSLKSALSLLWYLVQPFLELLVPLWTAQASRVCHARVLRTGSVPVYVLASFVYVWMKLSTINKVSLFFYVLLFRVPEDCNGHSHWLCHHGIHRFLREANTHPHQQHHCWFLSIMSGHIDQTCILLHRSLLLE